MKKENYFRPVLILFRLYMAYLGLFFLLRIFFLVFNRHYVHFNAGVFKILESFIQGFRFDLIPFSYGAAAVWVLLILNEISGKAVFKRIAFIFLFIWTSILIIIYLTDVVFYNKFAIHLNAQIYFWLKDLETVTKMILTSPQLGFILIPMLALITGWYFVLKKIFFLPVKKQLNRPSLWVPVYILVSTLLFFAAKGKIISHALRTEQAYTDDWFFWNDFKVNPFFNLRESWRKIQRERKLRLMNDSNAISLAQRLLHVKKVKYNSPVARDVFSGKEPENFHIVFIFMERKATWKMAYFGNRDTLTPFLDSLFLHSLAFDNFFSAGTRTFEGVFGSLYGYPVLFDDHPFYGDNTKARLQVKAGSISLFYGLPQILREKGYRTVFFCPHTPRFDNTGVFIPHNGFDKLYPQNSYPKDSLKTNWGVDDHFLFNFALNKMDSLAQTGKPFFSVIQTISDHEPYYVPGFIKGKSIEMRAARFADWALQDFFKKVRTKPWFDKTIFILAGDHGKPKDVIYPVDLPTHHVPLIFYGKSIKPAIKHTLGDQKDIMPTLMHLLGFSYLNNTFGKDLLNTENGYAFFNNYNLAGWIDDEYLSVIDQNGKIIGLYDYKTRLKKNLKDSLPSLSTEKAQKLKALLQASHYIRENNLQKKPEPLTPGL